MAYKYPICDVFHWFCKIARFFATEPGKPLTSYEVVVNLIAATTTSKGLEVKCVLYTNNYPKGIKIDKKRVEELDIIVMSFMENGITLSNQGISILIKLFCDEP